MPEQYTPILPHSSRGSLLAPRLFEILRIIGRYNANGSYPNRYQVAKQCGGAATHGFTAIRKLVAIGLVTDYQSGQSANTRQATSKLALTGTGKKELNHWSAYLLRELTQ